MKYSEFAYYSPAIFLFAAVGRTPAATVFLSPTGSDTLVPALVKIPSKTIRHATGKMLDDGSKVVLLNREAIEILREGF